MARSDMRDFEWDFIEKLLPNKSRGVKRVDDRRVINDILYALRTGIPWRDMPEQYGPWSTIYNRFNRWSKAGIWDMIFEAIVDSHNVDTVMVDSTSVRAHPTAAKLKKTDKRRCLGRSRGGLGTKIHASNNQDGLPLKLELTPNQANDAPPCGTLLTGLQPGQWVLADKAYDVNWIRNMIWEQGAIDVIPSKSNRKIPKEFDKVMYRQRNKIERFFGRLKASFRRIATRYEHTSANFLAMIKLACVRLWLEFYEYAAYRIGDCLGKRQAEIEKHLFRRERDFLNIVNRHSTVTPIGVQFCPPCGTERQLGRSRSWTSSRGRSIPSFLCKLSLLAFPSLHEEKEFSQPDGGIKLGRRYPSWRVNVARFSTEYSGNNRLL